MTATQPPAVSAGDAVSLWERLRPLAPFFALLTVIGFFYVAEAFYLPGQSRFLTPKNFQNIWIQTATVALAALGMTVIIIAGGIDLSVGTSLALCATVLAYTLRADAFGLFGSPETASDTRLLLCGLLAVGLCVLTGIACGLVNGLLISSLRVVPFIITLGTMTAFLGAAKLLGGETTIRPDLATQIPAWISKLVNPIQDPGWLTFPPGVWLVLVLAVGLSLVLKYTVFGRYVFALGSNEATARLCGIPVNQYKVLIYCFAGLFTGLAGMLMFARLSNGNPLAGSGLELKVIAAVVIGGGSLSGGRGSVSGTLAGAAIMTVIANGSTMLGLSNSVQDITLGVIIVAAVALDQLRQRAT